jgi:large subunit ribosomal protein L3
MRGVIMATGLLAKKVGMTQIFTPEGDCVPVTVLEAGPCTVVRRKTADKDGYDAVVLGFGPVDEKHLYRLTKPEVGVFKKAGTGVFKQNQRIDVTGTTKGRGFTGVVKKWGMKGAARDASTSHEHHRHVGAIGQRKTPGKVWKGKHLPGQYGVDTVTVQNLFVVGVEADKNLLLVSGAVPGHADGLLFVNTAAKGQPKAKEKQAEKTRAKPKV